MAVDITVPSVGESISEGMLARWLKKDGEAVRADEPVFELETEKATSEVPAPAAGTLRIITPEGQTVPIGSVVGRIEETAAGAKSPSAPAKDRAAAAAKATKPAAAPPPGDAEKTAPGPAPRAPAAQAGEAFLSPAARRLADEEHIDVKDLHGVGRGGRVTKQDVQAFLEQRVQSAPAQAAEPAPAATPEPRQAGDHPAAPPAALPVARETRQRMSSIRQRIAERLVASQKGTATLTTFNEADLSAVMALRGRYKDRFREKHGVGLGFMSFFVKACVEALRAYPVVNARIDGGDVVHQHFYNIGVAVSTEKGLMVPVLRDAERLGFTEVEKRIAELSQRARDGKITVTDLQGGTFTITNGGVFGSLLSTPILNPPQSAILGMHAIQKRPVAVGDQVAVHPMMYLALSYDHRLIDGRDAVLFLVRVKECVEDPERLLLEV
jgi:2-oxoglutarate dehydrogenase E2 component (dihydrolipoamide succinyltransferase)